VIQSKLDNIGGETLLVVTTARDLALRRAMLPERRLVPHESILFIGGGQSDLGGIG
jgi:hypothetical protein